MHDPGYGLLRIPLPRTTVNKGLVPRLSDDVSAVPLLKQLLPLLKQGPRGHPQGLGQEHRVGFAQHKGDAPVFHLPRLPSPG